MRQLGQLLHLSAAVTSQDHYVFVIIHSKQSSMLIQQHCLCVMHNQPLVLVSYLGHAFWVLAFILASTDRHAYLAAAYLV